jgi:hypothetical protein
MILLGAVLIIVGIYLLKGKIEFYSYSINVQVAVINVETSSYKNKMIYQPRVLF